MFVEALQDWPLICPIFQHVRNVAMCVLLCPIVCPTYVTFCVNHNSSPFKPIRTFISFSKFPPLLKQQDLKVIKSSIRVLNKECHSFANLCSSRGIRTNCFLFFKFWQLKILPKMSYNHRNNKIGPFSEIVSRCR